MHSIAIAIIAATLGINMELKSAPAQKMTPSPRQLAWHKMDRYAFIHFGPNTFSGKEWGDGKENVEIFNPTKLDCKQWVQSFKAAGMTGIIITAKHHDGFCLWPSKFSNHTVAQSPFKRDILKELSKACAEGGMKMGVYLSPWDRNHPSYGTPEYNDIFVNTLTEVLTQYGPIFEVWFDGANGEGPNGKRQVYDWPRFVETVRKHQPNAVIFSDGGPDVRWVGNEQGIGSLTNWGYLDRTKILPGTSRIDILGPGEPEAPYWVPAEVNVSIRPGWFWRESENSKVRTVRNLTNLYYSSVGRGGNLLLNVPPTSDGLIHPTDVSMLKGMGEVLDRTFRKNLVPAQHALASTQRKPVWSGTRGDSQILDLRKKTTFDVIELSEYIEQGQNVSEFSISAELDGKMTPIATGTTIGWRRLIRCNPVTTSKVEIKIIGSRNSFQIARFGLYATPDIGKDFSHETKEQKDIRMAWFRESRFGMFIHWGLYAIPGGEWNGKYYGGATEWLMDSAKIVPADWEPLKPRFNPAEFDAKKIVSAAKSAGMKYIVITSKHHEGFAMYPSQFGNWDIGDTPFKRDPLRELSEECQRQGIKFCTYYSIMDWHHPDYLPRRPWDKRPAAQAKFDRYVSTMKAQLKEIVTRYKPAIMWFDGEWEKTWNHDRGFDLYNYCRSLKPDMIVNNRVDVGRAGMGGFSGAASMGDYGTPEQEIPANGVQGDWESCMTMNNSWGFAKQDSSWKSTATLISNLVDCASKGGNYLLNVGPDELGRIPEPSLERLSEIGGWLLNSQQAIYGTTASPFPKSLPWGKVTRRGNTLYCIVTDSGAAHPELTGLKTSIVSAKTLDGAKIRIDTANEWPTLNIGTNASANGRAINPMVVAVELSGPPEVVKVVQGAQADGSFMLKAQDAIFSSPIRFENDKNSLGFWTDLAATVTWEFKCAKEGTYNLELELACENSSAGATVELFVNDQKRTLVVEGTGAWSTFKKVNLGTIRLTAANQKLLVRPLQMPGGAVMNLRGIKISPVRS